MLLSTCRTALRLGVKLPQFWCWKEKNAFAIYTRFSIFHLGFNFALLLFFFFLSFFVLRFYAYYVCIFFLRLPTKLIYLIHCGQVGEWVSWGRRSWLRWPPILITFNSCFGCYDYGCPPWVLLMLLSWLAACCWHWLYSRVFALRYANELYLLFFK